MSKKNLDNLFQEKLTNFKEAPDDSVWKSIEASLNKEKKDRKVIPIWWRLAGIAALLAVLLYIFPIKNTINIDPIISDTENSELPNADKNISKEITIPATNEVVENELVDETKQINVEKNQNKFTVPNNSKINHKAIVKNNVSSEELNKNTEKYNSNLEPKQNTISNDIADNHKKESENITLSKEEEIITNAAFNSIKENEIVQNDISDKQAEKNNRTSIYDIIDKKNIEEEIIVENTERKWSINPNIAPVYFNGIGNGSPIHTDFATNSKSGNINLSFGINVAYTVSKKLSLRTGIHRVNYGYNTNDIAFSSSLNSESDLANIDYAQGANNIVVESNTKQVAFSDVAAKETLSNTSLNGSMLQQFGYLEMPLELNYALIDKKIGLNLIGGFSSLFLTDNNVILESGEGLTTEVGEANNVNSVNFSTNIGFGLNYNLNPKTQFNIEPMFKYQLNTFSKTAGNFQPYSIGIYSGIKFKF